MRLVVRQRHPHRTAAYILRRMVAFGVVHLEVTLTAGKVVDYHLRHGHLVLGGLGQRYADRVADAVAHQRTYAHGTLDAPLETVSGLRDTQMYRIGHPLAVHRLDQKAVGMNHDARIARLHRHHDLIERLFAADAQELHRRGHHPFGGIAPLVENALRERTVIHADADRHAALPASVDEGFELPVR